MFPTIGILAGMGPRSTAPFLDLIISECQRQYGARHDMDFPPMLIYSLPTPFYLDRPPDHGLMRRTIAEGLRRLAATGVAFIAMPCNTAHIYYEHLAAAIEIPLLNMAEESVRALPRPPGRVGLIATRPTVASGLYQSAIRRANGLCVHNDDLQSETDALLGSIKASVAKAESEELWLRLLHTLEAQDIDALLIACTDVSVVSREYRGPLSIVETSQELARATVRKWLEMRA